jgi:hypothetical protein
MNFDAFWQTHRRFILGLAGGVVVFFILLAISGGGANDRFAKARGSIARARRQMGGNAMYGTNQVATLEQRLAELRERNRLLAERDLPAFRKRFQVPVSTPAAQHYISLTGELRDELIGWALRRNCEIDDSLGLPPVSPSQPQQIERVLRGLDVVDRVIHMAVDFGAAEVDKIRIAQKRRRRTGRNVSPLDITPVSMEVTFHRASIAPFLNAIIAEQAAGRPLGLTGLEVLPRNEKRMEQKVLLEFGVGALPEPVDGEDLQ